MACLASTLSSHLLFSAKLLQMDQPLDLQRDKRMQDSLKPSNSHILEHDVREINFCVIEAAVFRDVFVKAA